MKLRISFNQLTLHLMLIPAIIVTLIYSYGPMVGLVMAFQNYIPTKGLFGSEWVGLYHFKFVMSLPDTYTVIWNTLYIALMKIVSSLTFPLLIALLLNEIKKELVKRGIQTLIYLPHFLSWIILSGILIDVLSLKGVINGFLGVFGIDPILFLGNNNWFPYVMVISDQWKEFGFSTIIYLAALTGINPALYEAAIMDGANRWRQTWHITLPGMTPIIVLLMTLSLGNVLNAGFDQIFNLYSPSVYASGDIIDTMVYRMGLIEGRYSLATAVGLFKSVVSLFMISMSYYMAYRFANYRIF